MDRKLTPSPSECWCWYYCNSFMLELYCVVQVASEEEMHICLPAGMNVVCMQRSECFTFSHQMGIQYILYSFCTLRQDLPYYLYIANWLIITMGCRMLCWQYQQI